jgi:predicted RNase H-like HicB family nuclease
MIFHIVLEPETEGGFSVVVPALDGCYTQGKTKQEAIANAKEAIVCYLKGLEEVNRIESSHQAQIQEIEVSI